MRSPRAIEHEWHQRFREKKRELRTRLKYQYILHKKIGSSDLMDIKNCDIAQFTYDDSECILQCAGKERFQAFMDIVYEKAIERLRKKPKIRIAFILYDASMWCGDRLYQYFADDERFDPSVMLVLRQDQKDNPDVQKDFQRGIEQMQSRGLNVVPVREDGDAAGNDIDIHMFLIPYDAVLTNEFLFKNMKLTKLLTYIPYGSDTTFCVKDMYLERHAWKVFNDTRYICDLMEETCGAGGKRAQFTGFPKTDAFYSESKPEFSWKQTNPSAKKIIYAPHWSIDGGIQYATFQWNYQFFYEYAKAHPDTTSWIVKPHPNLLYSAVDHGIFRSADEFEAYMHKWEELPNAVVYTGGYYQDIFMTSDAMILDSASFLLEYQFIHKPILFLTREGEAWNKIGKLACEASYLAPGDDLAKIQEFIEDVVIGDKDWKQQEREAFFRKYLDYKSLNGMLASENIYQTIHQIIA